MKVGDRVIDLLYKVPYCRGEGTVISMTPCHQKECGCPGFVQVHWDNEEEPDEEEDFIQF